MGIFHNLWKIAKKPNGFGCQSFLLGLFIYIDICARPFYVETERWGFFIFHAALFRIWVQTGFLWKISIFVGSFLYDKKHIFDTPLSERHFCRRGTPWRHTNKPIEYLQMKIQGGYTKIITRTPNSIPLNENVNQGNMGSVLSEMLLWKRNFATSHKQAHMSTYKWRSKVKI